jgi:hypothetical protein
MDEGAEPDWMLCRNVCLKLIHLPAEGSRSVISLRIYGSWSRQDLQLDMVPLDRG